MIEGFAVVEQFPVQWSDMDAFRHVNNARFFSWFEAARIAYFRRVGLATDRAADVGPILAHTSCDFIAPVEYPADVVVGARTTRIGGSSFDHEYTVAMSASPDEPVARGVGVIVMYDYTAQTSVTIPDEIRSRMTALDAID